MNFTKIGLKNLDAGDLQNLAVDLLQRLYKDWSIITHNGILEGTSITRPGTPDAYCQHKDGNYVFIQATTDKNRKNKAKDDLLNSLSVLEDLGKKEGALCVAFVNFDPNPGYFDECIRLCKEHGCTFKAYTNSEITYELENNYVDLRNKYIEGNNLTSKDSRAIRQAIRSIEGWITRNNTYVKSSYFEAALKCIEEKHFVNILGKAMNGKTTIAMALIIELMERYENYKPIFLRLDEFKDMYDPDDKRRIYFFDDVFGEYDFEEDRLRNSSKQTFDCLKQAVDQGAFVIFTSRNYIFDEVSRIKKSKLNFDFLFRSNAEILVDKYSQEEKKAILTNHLNYGDIAEQRKHVLQIYIQEIIESNNFNPELARWLGDSSVTEYLEINSESLKNFFDKPNDYLRLLFEQIDEDKQASLLLVLLRSEGLVRGIKDDDIDPILGKYYDTTAAKINNALESMNTSFVRIERIESGDVWLSMHPTFKEALIPLLKDKTDLFIRFADFNTIVKQVSLKKEDSEHVYIPKDDEYKYWNDFSKIIFEAYWQSMAKKDSIYDYEFYKQHELTRFFLDRVTDEYLLWFDGYYSDSKEMWELLTRNNFFHLHSIPTYRFAHRLFILGILPQSRREAINQEIINFASREFDITFFEKSFKELLGEENFKQLLYTYVNKGAQMAFERLDEDLNSTDESEINTEDDAVNYFNAWLENVKFMENQLIKYNLWNEEKKVELKTMLDKADETLMEVISDIEADDEYYSDIVYNIVAQFVEVVRDLEDSVLILDEFNNALGDIMDELSCDTKEAASKLTSCLIQARSDGKDWLETVQKRLRMTQE